MMEDSKSGMTWLGVLFVIIVVYVIFCNGGGLFGNCGGYGTRGGMLTDWEAEKQQIIDSAKTQYLIEQQGAETRAANQAGFDALQAQNSRIYEQGLQESLFDAKMKIQSLEGQIFTKEQTDGIAKSLADCCCGINRRMDAIEAVMLKQPPFYPYGYTFQGWPTGCNTCCTNV